jgi:hypothetical protein
MQRAQWRPVRVRTAFEKEDRDYNERVAERLLADAAAADFVIAVDLVGWRRPSDMRR